MSGEGIVKIRKHIDSFLIVLGVLSLFFLVKHAVVGCDGVDRFNAAHDFIRHRKLSTTPYSMIGPLFSAPLYLLGKCCMTYEWWCARFNVLVLVFGLIVFYRVMIPHMASATVKRFLLIIVGASMFPNHMRNFHAEVFTAIMVGLSITIVFLRGSWWGWLAGILGVANTPGALIGYGLVVAKRTFARKRLRYLVVLMVIVLVIMGENWLRHGGPFESHYTGNKGMKTALPYSGLPGFSYPFFFGVLSILFSFGKGLVFFAPGLLLSRYMTASRVGEKVASCYQAYSLFLAGLILVYARWWSWYGGFIWGPRFFLIASIPASLALAWCLGEQHKSIMLRVSILLALLLSVWVSISGAVFDVDCLGICNADNYAMECVTWYVPEFSVLWRPFVESRTLHREDYWLILYGVVVFLYLGLPMMRTTAVDISKALRSRILGWCKLSEWRI